MIVKPMKHSYFYLLLFICCILILDFVLLYRLRQTAIIGAVVVTLVCGGVAFLYGMVTCRTLRFEKEGCTVSFLGFQKFTQWNKLVIKQEERFKGAVTYPGAFAAHPKSGAVFSAQKKLRPHWLGLEEYCIFYNPFSTFYVVYSEPDSRVLQLSSHIVEKETFLAELVSFGVKLEQR